ncbi:MAG: PDZ domain-containing protein [Candidatus Eisenbacteria bacterium]
MSTSFAEQLSNNLAELLARNAASVVSVHCRRTPTSGAVWSSEGLILVTAHALEREDDLAVTVDGGARFPAKLLGRDAGTDLALLALDGGGSLPTLMPTPFAEASDVRVGHLLLTISRPGRSARGNLSMLAALGDSWRSPSGGRIDRYVELGTGVFTGLSGSLVVAMNGQAIGIATAGLVRGTATLLPTATLRRVVEALRAQGRVKRGYLGVSSHPVRLGTEQASALGQPTALLVLSVHPESPAGKAGLLLGDAILSFDGQKLGHPQELLALLDEEKVGTDATIRILRAGVPIDVRCRIGTREETA